MIGIIIFAGLVVAGWKLYTYTAAKNKHDDRINRIDRRQFRLFHLVKEYLLVIDDDCMALDDKIQHKEKLLDAMRQTVAAGEIDYSHAQNVSDIRSVNVTSIKQRAS